MLTYSQLSDNRVELSIGNLAKQVRDDSQKDIQNYKRDMQRNHIKVKKPPIPNLVYIEPWDVLKTEIITDQVLECKELFKRQLEF